MDMQGSESEVAQLVRKARMAKKISQPELARRVGTTQQTIEKIESGKIKHSSYLPAIAKELSIAIERVVRNPNGISAVETIPASRLIGERDLSVYASVQGGPGAIILSNEPVEYVARPEPLARVRDGYGVIVIEDSMAPEYRSGDIALINPHLPPRTGDTCIFRRHDRDGTQHACIKYLRRVTETAWHVTEWNSDNGGPREFVLRRTEWQIAHVAVASYKRR